MLGRLLVLVVLVAALLWFLRWFRRTRPEQVARMIKRGALWGAIGFLLLMVATGRLNPLFAALAAAVPVVMRGLNVLRMLPAIQQVLRMLGLTAASGAAGGGAAGSGQTSSIRTRFLEMTLDHASGDMDGLVLEGPYQGQLLSRLDLDELLGLFETCQAQDAQSAAVLAAYLDRTHGTEWSDARPGGGGADGGGTTAGAAPMSREEALAVLGLGAGAEEEDIRGAHRRLIQKFHPDRGGSDYLAAKINEAKRLLLGD